ncbi:hypothetical protein, partial [Salmonella sp. s51090]|uniref:hypothetical protein n=1 Tax=Salmonella sp. s51090 TaxID=3159651 RepID=UPI0039800015
NGLKLDSFVFVLSVPTIVVKKKTSLPTEKIVRAWTLNKYLIFSGLIQLMTDISIYINIF